MDNIEKKLNKIISIYQILFYLRVMKITGSSINSIYRKYEDVYDDFFFLETSEILIGNNIIDEILVKREDIILLYNFLIKNIYNKMEIMLSNIEPFEVKYFLYSIAAYQAEFHTRSMNILNGGIEISECININPLEIEILECMLVNKNYLNEFDSINAMDKMATQYLTNSYFKINPIESNHWDFDGDKFLKVYLLAHVIIQLIYERELITSKFQPGMKVEIKGGSILNINYSNELLRRVKEDYLSDIHKNIDTYPEDVMIKLDNNLYKVCGFRIKTIEEFLKVEYRTIPDESITTIVDRENLIKAIKQDTNCDRNEAIKIIEYLTIKINSESTEIYNSVETSHNRIFEKAFAEVYNSENSIYLFSYPLIVYSWKLLKRKLLYNLIPECRKLNSKIIERYCKNEFVIRVKQCFEKYTDNVIINTHKIKVCNEHIQKQIILENEIDVLGVIGQKLFIVECKDIYYSFTPFGYRQDIGKTIGFINNMKKKVDNITDLINDFEMVFGSKINEIIPIIVFRTYNMSIPSTFDKKEIHITNFSELENDIRNFL